MADDDAPEPAVPEAGRPEPGSGDEVVEAGTTPAKRPGRVRPGFTAALAVALALLLACTMIDSGFSSLSTGPAVDASAATAGEIRDPRFPQGTFLYTTVEVFDLNLFQRILWPFRLDTTSRLVPHLLDTAPTAGDALFVSKHTALELAAILADPDAAGTRVLVDRVEGDSPAAAAGLHPGDVVRGVDGAPVDTTEDLIDAVRAQPGRTIRLSVDRDGTQLLLEATTEVRAGVGRLGVLISTVAAPPRLPHLDIVTDKVSGASAGLIFTLTFLDALSPGDLAAGMTVAGTGTIDRAGSVGEIGGADLKLRGAAAAGADVFFLPAGNEVRPVPGGVPVVKVASVLEAIAWLCDHGATDAVCTTTMLG